MSQHEQERDGEYHHITITIGGGFQLRTQHGHDSKPQIAAWGSFPTFTASLHKTPGTLASHLGRVEVINFPEQRSASTHSQPPAVFYSIVPGGSVPASFFFLSLINDHEYPGSTWQKRETRAWTGYEGCVGWLGRKVKLYSMYS
jgi:hypothetical protein